MGGRVSSVKNIKNNNSNTSMIRKENAKMTVAEYMDYATAHGIGRVKNSPYIILKIFWVLAVLGSIVIVAVQLSRLTDKWKRYVQ